MESDDAETESGEAVAETTAATVGEAEPSPVEPVLPMKMVDATTPPADMWLDGRTVNVTVYVYKNRLNDSFHACEVEPYDYNRMIRQAIAEGAMVAELFPDDLVYSQHDFGSGWTIPTTRQLDRYRSDASVFNRTAGGFVVQPLLLKQRLLAGHLTRLGETAIERVTDDRGRIQLTESSEDLLERLHPSIVDAIYEKYLAVASIRI